jgi:hypothetical protein
VQLDPDIEPTTRRSLSLVLEGFEIRPPMNGGMAQLLVGPKVTSVFEPHQHSRGNVCAPSGHPLGQGS